MRSMKESWHGVTFFGAQLPDQEHTTGNQSRAYYNEANLNGQKNPWIIKRKLHNAPGFNRTEEAAPLSAFW